MTITEQDIMQDLNVEADGLADLEDDVDYGADEDSSIFEGELEDEYAELWAEDDAFSEDYADESLGQTLGSILGAEDEDEFLGKLFRGAKTLVKKAAPIVGKIARGAAPILSAIPHPAAQGAAQIAGILGKLKAEGASVDEALEIVAEAAARDPRALPVVAGLAARSVIRNRGSAMPAAQRQQVATAMTKAARTLVSSGGPKAIRALPKITKSVKRTAAARGVPTSVQPKIVARTAAKVVQNPGMLRRLSAPSPRAQSMVQRANGGYGATRTISVPGPATVTINVG